MLAEHHPGDALMLHIVHSGGSAEDYRVVLGTQPQSPGPAPRCGK
jgi:hypothetical protein